jgi:hypothetical protein
MSELAKLQRALQRAVLEDAPETTPHFAHSVVGTQEAAAADRIAVYRDAYRLRLTDALAANYPRLRELIGEDTFNPIAESHIDAHRSRNASIRWFGEHLAQDLQRSFAAQPWIGELAAWEWAIAHAFDAKDAQRVSMQSLAEVAADEWPTLRFDFHPSVQCVYLKSNAPALFKALTEDTALPEPATGEDSAWLIWRDDLTPCFRSLSPHAAAALTLLMRGATFEAMCTELCAWYAADEAAREAATLLREWLDAGMICGFSIARADH